MYLAGTLTGSTVNDMYFPHRTRLRKGPRGHSAGSWSQLYHPEELKQQPASARAPKRSTHEVENAIEMPLM